MSVDIEGLEFAEKVAQTKWDKCRDPSAVDMWVINNADAIRELQRKEQTQ